MLEASISEAISVLLMETTNLEAESKELQRLQGNLDTMNKEIESLNISINHLKASTDDLIAKQQHVQAECDARSIKIAKIQKQIEGTKEDIASVEILSLKLKDEHEKLVIEKQKKLKHLKQEIQKYESEYQHKSNTLKQEEALLAETKKKYQAQEQEAERVQLALDNLKASCEELNKKINSMNENHQLQNAEVAKREQELLKIIQLKQEEMANILILQEELDNEMNQAAAKYQNSLEKHRSDEEEAYKKKIATETEAREVLVRIAFIESC